MELTADQQQELRACTQGEPEVEIVNGMLRDAAAKADPVILVIDDDPAITFLVKKVLAQKGYTPLVTDNPRVALGLLRFLAPRLILLDVNMPEMDGSELFVRIREIPNANAVPVVYMTGLISPDEEQDFTLGAAMQGIYLAKPFTADKLLKVVASIVTK